MRAKNIFSSSVRLKFRCDVLLFIVGYEIGLYFPEPLKGLNPFTDMICPFTIMQHKAACAPVTLFLSFFFRFCEMQRIDA